MKKNDLSSRMRNKKSIKQSYYDPSYEEVTPKKRKKQESYTFLDAQREKREKRKQQELVEESFDAGWHQSGEVRKRSQLEYNPLSAEIDLDALEDPVMEQAQEESIEYEKTQKLKRRLRIKNKVITGFLVFMCIYMIFLIYGCISTDYYYNDKGRIVPQVLGISDVRKKKEFDVVYDQYKNVCEYYKKILILDYRIEHAKNKEEIKVIATEYTSMVSALENLGKTLNGMNCSKEYENIKSLLVSFVYIPKTSGNAKMGLLEQYCTEMSNAYTGDDQSQLELAIQDRDNVLNLYNTITENMYSVGKSLAGIDVTPMVNFNPYTYGEDYVNGKVK